MFLKDRRTTKPITFGWYDLCTNYNFPKIWYKNINAIR